MPRVQDREEQKDIERQLRMDFAKQGIHVAEKADGDTFDSNVITPGTEFMDRLAMVLQWCARFPIYRGSYHKSGRQCAPGQHRLRPRTGSARQTPWASDRLRTQHYRSDCTGNRIDQTSVWCAR